MTGTIDHSAPPVWSPTQAAARYFVLTFVLTWSLLTPMVLGKDGLGVFAYHVPIPLYVALFLLSALCPTTAAYLVLRRNGGKDGVRAWLSRFTRWRVGAKWFAIVFLGYPVLQLATASILTGFGALGALAAGWPKIFTNYLPAMLIFPAIINWGEEPGWRGFALSTLQPQVGPWKATLVVGVLHGLWHLPIFLLVSGPPAAGPFHLGKFLFNTGMITVISIIWTWVYNNARQSILIASLLHASGNATGMLMSALMPALNKQLFGYLNGAAYAMIAATVLIATRGRLGYRAPEPRSTA